MVVGWEFNIRLSLAPSFSLPFLWRETLGTRLHSLLLLCISLALPRSFSSSPHTAAFHATSLYLSTLSPSHCRPRFPTCSEPKTSYTSALLADKPPSSICVGKKIICPSIPFAPYTTTIPLYAHVTRMSNSALQKQMIYCEAPRPHRRGLMNFWTKMKKATGIETEQLQKTMYNRNDFNKWMRDRYGFAPRPAKSGKPGPC